MKGISALRRGYASSTAGKRQRDGFVVTTTSAQGARRHTLKLWLLIGLASFAVLLTIGGIASALSPAKGTPKASTSTSAPVVVKTTPKAAPKAAPKVTHTAAPAPVITPKVTHTAAPAPPAVTASNLPPLVYGEELPVQFANDLQAAGISGPALAWLTSGGPITHISSVGEEICGWWATPGGEPGWNPSSELTDPQAPYGTTPTPVGIKASQVPVVEAIINRDICQNPDNQF